jgi:hypothetical protein
MSLLLSRSRISPLHKFALATVTLAGVLTTACSDTAGGDPLGAAGQVAVAGNGSSGAPGGGGSTAAGAGGVSSGAASTAANGGSGLGGAAGSPPVAGAGTGGGVSSGGTATGGAATGGSAGAAGASTVGGSAPVATCPGGPTPAATWQEHWFEHVENLKLVEFNDCAAIYFDDGMDKTKAAWIVPFVTNVWKYSLATYGAMGPERVYAIFHQGKYSGGHPSYYYDASHDNHNVSDVGGGNWNDGNWDVTSHELGHIVESTASHTKYGSPAFGLWKDSKWMEFYQYDVYVGLGMDEHAKVVFDRFTNQSDDFPRAGTRWFRDWFYPLWRDYGHAQVMVRFFGLLEQYYAAQNKRMGNMTWGEYVHFTSGAAKKDLKPLATTAFGWPADWDAQLAAARQKYPQITY